MGKRIKSFILQYAVPHGKGPWSCYGEICEAFADNGYEVDIIAPRLWRREAGDVSAYYVKIISDI